MSSEEEKNEERNEEIKKYMDILYENLAEADVEQLPEQDFILT